MADATTWDTLKNAVLRSGESRDNAPALNGNILAPTDAQQAGAQSDSINNWTLREAHAAATRLYLDTVPKIDVQKPVQAPPENSPANNIASTVSNIIHDGGIPVLRNESRSAEFGLSLMNSKSNNFQIPDGFSHSEPLRFPGKTEPKDYTPGVYVKFKF